MPPASPTLIILGASARAAAASALRAGFAPWCADLFADADLVRAGPARRVETAQYPKGLIAAAAEAPTGPWMYTGALENRPDFVGKIHRPLWGNPPQVLRRVRSPKLLTAVLLRNDLPAPTVHVGARATDQRRYLIKPFRSAGGAQIRFLAADASFDVRRSYLQEWIDGEPCSAVFVGNAEGRAILLGVTRQWIGESWLGAAPFQWCGNVGPLTLASSTATTLQRIGQVLVTDFQLRGLFGVDFILRDGIPWTVEVNPRYPASLEVLERATGQPLLTYHARAFDASAPTGVARPPIAKVIAKAILFARQPATIADHRPWQTALEMPLDDLAVPFADIPAIGTRIETGHPICTVFAGANDVISCLTLAGEAVQALERALAIG